MLIGFGTKEAILGVILYLCAHSLFKGALFMVAGAIDHGTGTRDITVLGGLREHMPITFIAAIIAAISMAGFPIALGFLAKEEMYLAMTSGLWPDLLFLAVLIIGNALMMVVGAAIAFKPFLGPLRPTPHEPARGRAGSVHSVRSCWRCWALVAGLFTGWLNTNLLNPTGAARSTTTSSMLTSHLAFDLTNPAVWASIATWVLGGIVFWQARCGPLGPAPDRQGHRLDLRQGLRRLDVRADPGLPTR